MSIQSNILRSIESFLSKRIENFIVARTKVREALFFQTFEPRDTDIYIATYFKSGTTWMQMILYQLLTDGNMEFEHIYSVSPWLINEAGKKDGADRINSLDKPRVFKAHEPYEEFEPKNKNKFIYVYREGKDVAVSLYHHRKNYNDSGETLDQVFESYFTGGSYNWFRYNKDWLENKNKFNILYVNYADLKNNFEETIQQIAGFLHVNIDEELITRIKERSSFEFMKAHETKFGEQAQTQKKYDQFIRKGNLGDGDQLNESQKQAYNGIFKKELERLAKRHNLH
jgi:hypothetical protein